MMDSRETMASIKADPAATADGCHVDAEHVQNSKKMVTAAELGFAELLCGWAQCSFRVNHLKGVPLHYRKEHPGVSLLEAVFLDGGTGRRLSLFDIFPFVFMCQVCQAVRNGGQLLLLTFSKYYTENTFIRAGR